MEPNTLELSDKQVNISVIPQSDEKKEVQQTGPDFRIAYSDVPYEIQIPIEYPRLVWIHKKYLLKY